MAIILNLLTCVNKPVGFLPRTVGLDLESYHQIASEQFVLYYTSSAKRVIMPTSKQFPVRVVYHCPSPPISVTYCLVISCTIFIFSLVSKAICVFCIVTCLHVIRSFFHRKVNFSLFDMISFGFKKLVSFLSNVLQVFFSGLLLSNAFKYFFFHAEMFHLYVLNTSVGLLISSRFCFLLSKVTSALLL